MVGQILAKHDLNIYIYLMCDMFVYIFKYMQLFYSIPDWCHSEYKRKQTVLAGRSFSIKVPNI